MQMEPAEGHTCTDMTTNVPADESDFQGLMEAMDRQLRAQGVPIMARPLRAYSELCKQFKMSVALPLPKRDPRPGSYSGTDLIIRSFRWYKDRYGDALKADYSPGSTVVIIRDDPWLIELPRLIGTFQVGCDPLAPPVTGNRMTSGTMGTENVLDSVRNLPLGLRSSLRPEECAQIQHAFILALGAYSNLQAITDLQYVPEVLSDLLASVIHLNQQRGHEGQSRWSSLQAAEKILKSYLVAVNVTVPKKGHDLKALADLAAANGLPAVPEDLVTDAQCPAGVRYGEIATTLVEAVKAQHAALAICEGVARFIQQRRQAKK